MLAKLRALIFSLGLASGFASPALAGTASFLVVHGIPGRDVAAGLDPQLPVDVLVNGSICLLKNFTFGQIAGPYDVPAGTYSVAVSLANPISPCSNAAVISGNVTLTSGEFGAIVAQLSPKGAPTAGVYPIDVLPVGKPSQRFVVIHAADAPPVFVHGISLGTSPVKFTLPLATGMVKSADVAAQSGYSATISAGSASFGPANVFGAPQSLFLIVAVGNAGSGSVTLLSKTIPSVF